MYVFTVCCIHSIFVISTFSVVVPTFVEQPMNATVQELGSVNFSCVVSARPAPTITWAFEPTFGSGFEVIQNATNMVMPAGVNTLGTITSTVLLMNVDFAARGRYSCIFLANTSGLIAQLPPDQIGQRSSVYLTVNGKHSHNLQRNLLQIVAERKAVILSANGLAYSCVNSFILNVVGFYGCLLFDLSYIEYLYKLKKS